MTSLAEHVSFFLHERLPRERQVSEQTCSTYAVALRLFFEFAAQHLNLRPSQIALEQLDAPLVLAFLTHLEAERHNSPKTRNLRLAAIRSFMRFIEYREPAALAQVQRVLAIPMKRTESPLTTYLTATEVQALLKAPAQDTRHGVRDYSMLYLTYTAGLRVSELVSLRLENLAYEPQFSLQIFGKGRRERVLPLWQQSAKALQAWLAIRPSSPAPEVFLNARGRAMTRSGFEYVLRKHMQTARQNCPSLTPKRVSPHSLRHSCAMMVLQATGDIRKVALWLGHASIQTTEQYLRADPTTLLEAMNAATPPALTKGRFNPPDQLIQMLTAE